MKPAAALARLVVTRPRRVLIVALLLSAALVPLVLRIRLDTDVTRLVPRGREEAAAFARFARTFVAEQVLIVLAESDDPAKLPPFAEALAEALGKRPDVAEVRFRLGRDAATFMRDHLTQLLTVDEIAAVRPRLEPEALEKQARRLRGLLSAPGGSGLAPILTADPLELLPVLAARLESGLPVDTQSGYFRSADGRALMIYVRPSFTTYDVEADRALIAATAQAAERLGARVTDGDFTGRGLEVGFTGAAAYTLWYRDWLHRDASSSTPLSAAAVLILFAVVFRSLRVLPLVGVPLALGLLWTGAAAALAFGRVNAVSLTFGTVLLSIGIDFPIQIYNRLQEELITRPPREALEVTMRDMLGPSVTATLGPAVVLFACALSEYRGLAELGVLAGVGLLFNIVAMFTVLPALLAVLPPKLWAKARRMPPGGGLLGALGRAAARRPKAIIFAALVVAAAALPFALRVHFDDRLITIHPQDMPPVKTEAELSRKLGERERMLVALIEERDPERALERADAWTRAADRLRREGLLRGYQSSSSLFPSQKTQAERRAAWEAAGAVRAAGDLKAALEATGFDAEPFEPFLRQLAAPPPPLRVADAKKTDLDFLVRNHIQDGDGVRRVAVFLFPAAGRQAELMRALEEIAAREGGVVTGVPVLERVLREIVERDTLVVTAVSTAAVLLLLALYYRRARPWLAVVLPLSFAWILFAAALGGFGLPLNLFNLLTIPLVIGYGIDDHVFLLHRHAQAPAAGPAPALTATGRAIVVTSLATIAGFLPLALARFDGLKLFGLSGALSVACCLVACLALLPAVLTLLWPPRAGEDR